MYSMRMQCYNITISNLNFVLSLTINLLTTTIVAPPSNASKWQMGFNSAFKGLKEHPEGGVEMP